jgi:hypothetical protein
VDIASKSEGKWSVSDVIGTIRREHLDWIIPDSKKYLRAALRK